MSSILLALVLSASAPATQTPAALAQAEPADAGTVYAVFHRGDAALRDGLIRSHEVWTDAGEFLIGNFTADEVHALARKGIASEPLGAATMRDELWLVSEREVEHMGGALAPETRTLLATGTLRVVAVAPGRTPAGGAAVHGCHAGVSRVVRQRLQPLQPFTWRGLPGGGKLGIGTPDPRIQALVDQVSQANLSAKIASLSGLFTRRADRPEADTARNMIKGWFDGFGLSTRLENFSASFSENVIAEIPGTVHPDEIVVLGAHYDSINGSGASLTAPGADDNTSGSSGVVEMARILAASGPFERTIRLMTYCAE